MGKQNDEELFLRELSDLINKYEVDELLMQDAELLAKLMYAPLDILIENSIGRNN